MLDFFAFVAFGAASFGFGWYAKSHVKTNMVADEVTKLRSETTTLILDIRESIGNEMHYLFDKNSAQSNQSASPATTENNPSVGN